MIPHAAPALVSLTYGALTLGLSGMLVVAATAKLLHRWQFAAVLRSWHLLPRRAVAAVSVAFPIFELAAGVTVMVLASTGFGRILAAELLVAVFGVFLVGQGVVLLRVGRAACGCTGRPPWDAWRESRSPSAACPDR